jgi:hypothetical protein
MERPKRQLTEEQLKKLADARKKAIEVRKQKGELNRAKKQEAKDKFQEEYDAKVLKKSPAKPAPKETPIEETDKDIYEATSPPPTEDDYPIEIVKKSKAQGSAPARRKEGGNGDDNPLKEPNYKQIYYQHKLAMLQAQQQEQQARQNYAQLPPYQHTIDIAKHQIKERVDKTVYENVYRQLFSS